MPDSFLTDGDHRRFGEPAKFMPVAFICGNIAMLWCIFMVYHCLPLWGEPETHKQALIQTLIFNAITIMLGICYVRCILTHPGTIPGKEDSAELSLQETKRSGDRRHCKWCDKYKPDRCHHCRVCRTCILRMDHHCPWIYNCVGFRNHKFFFLLLFYSALACHMIVWTMWETLKASVAPEIPFLEMFMVLFGETLAAFLGFMVTAFFCFHIWLMLKAMTTIEFCEKSMKRTGYDTNAYDRGAYGNMRAVLGDNPLLWLLPCSLPSGDGMTYITEEAPLLRMASGDAGRAHKKMDESTKPPKHQGKKRTVAGTGECEGSDASVQGSDSGSEHDPAKPFEERASMMP